MPPVTITPELIALCADFATRSDVSYYATTGQNNPVKIREQIRDGKIGEFVTYHTLKHKGTISTPDLNLYKVGERSWKADLDFRDVKEKPFVIHVKTQTVESGKKHGVSWCFSTADKEIFGTDRQPNALVVFVQIRLDENPLHQGRVAAIVPLNQLHQLNCFDEPKVQKFRGKKRFVYLKRLKELGLVKEENK